MEGKAAYISYSPQRLAFIRRHHALSGVLDYVQAAAPCDIHYGIHLAGHAGVMDRYYCFGLFGNGSFYQLLIDVHCIGPDVHEYRFCPAEYKCIRR